jgi:hypothetical protein
MTPKCTVMPAYEAPRFRVKRDEGCAALNAINMKYVQRFNVLKRMAN